METIKDPTVYEPRRGVLFHCPVCGQDAELYVHPICVDGGWPVQRGVDGEFPQIVFEDMSELSFTPRYMCFSCGATFPYDDKFITKLLKE